VHALAPLERLELSPAAPEADALSAELQGHAREFYHRAFQHPTPRTQAWSADVSEVRFAGQYQQCQVCWSAQAPELRGVNVSDRILRRVSEVVSTIPRK
jgi:hypothetical protein